MSSIKALLDYGRECLEASGNEYAKYERKVILEHVTGRNYMYMLMNGDEEVSSEEETLYKQLITRRCEHYPLQYLLGYAHFMDYTFYVDENVLIPRNDTEILVETVNSLYDDVSSGRDNVRILDLCCGSGCIGISVKLYHNDCRLTLSDISEKALAIAKRNAEKYNIDVTFNCGNLFDGITDKYDIIVCNPPYIVSDIIKTLMPEVRDYEPHIALDGGGDGLDYYRHIVNDCERFLDEKGYIFFEIGYDQGAEVSKLLKDNGFSDVTLRKDYAGMDRVIHGHL